MILIVITNLRQFWFSNRITPLLLGQKEAKTKLEVDNPPHNVPQPLVLTITRQLQFNIGFLKNTSRTSTNINLRI